MKQNNICGAKGLAVMRLDGRETSATHRGGVQMTTKLSSTTQASSRENPKEQFTSLAHLLTVEYLEGCFWELKRDKASGIDGTRIGDTLLKSRMWEIYEFGSVRDIKQSKGDC